MKRRTVLIAVVVMLLMFGLILIPAAQGEPTAQDDPTAQQQTVDAIIQARFTLTAEAEQLLVLTQVAQTQAAQPEPPSPPTQTAAFEATVDAAFAQAIQATAQVEMMAAVTARGLEIITPQSLPRLEQLGNLNQSIRNATRAAFSPDGKTLAVGNARGAVMVWDMAAGAEVRRFSNQSDAITAVAFAPNGRLLVASSKDERRRPADPGR
jgi:cytoskeletal protein RodZ